jgi:hypothetical protein
MLTRVFRYARSALARNHRPRCKAISEALLIVAGACFISLAFGSDNNWDLRNYHLYNPFAFVTERYQKDLFAAGPQTYFNPLLDLPYYIVAVQLIPGYPRLVAFLAGVPFGLLAVVVLLLARRMLPLWLPGRNCLAIGSTAVGLTGTACVSEIGTTYGDIPIAVLILGGVYWPLSLLSREEFSTTRWSGAVGIAGLCAGLAAGLKPVAGIFAPGLAVGLAVAAGGLNRFLLTGSIVATGWLIGFAAAFMPWGLTVNAMFGNPIFPYMNNVFASPWVPELSYADHRFLPKDAWPALFFPFYWLRGRAFVVAELNVRDPRFALAYVSVVILAYQLLWRRLSAAKTDCKIARPPAVAFLLFFVISFILWEATFGILRYLAALEAITGILITLGLASLLSPLRGYRRSRPIIIATTSLVLIATFAASSRPGWGRVRTWSSSVFVVDAPAVPDHGLVVFANEPVAFVAPFLKGDDLTFVGLSNVPRPSRLRDEIAHAIATHSAVLAVVRGPISNLDALADAFGFRIVPDGCVPIRSNNEPNLSMCRTEPRSRGVP